MLITLNAMITSKNVSLIFPVPIAEICTKNTNLNVDTKNSIMKLCNLNVLEKHGNWCSNDNLNIDNNFKKLVSFINDTVLTYLDEIYKCNSDDFYMTGMWANVHKSFSKHHIHSHPNSFLSGVFYIDIPQGAGDIFFKDPRMGSQVLVPDYKETPNFMFHEMQFSVHTGKLILFPSYLEHGTHLGNDHEGYRISVSFNYMLKKSSSYLTYKF